MRFLWSFAFLLCLSQVGCATGTEFSCTAWCLSDSTDDGMVQNEVSKVIEATDLGEAVTTCQTWLSCHATPSDQTQCGCSEVR